VIDSDVISKWLSINKGSIKKTLTKNYILDVDYTIKNEKVLLTCDCFKRLGMLSRTKKAEEVRSYFLDLEKHLDNYKNYIMEGLNHKIKINKSSKKQTKNKKKTINSKDIAKSKKISKSL
jgi:phage anti-repressor protein